MLAALPLVLPVEVRGVGSHAGGPSHVYEQLVGAVLPQTRREYLELVA